MEAELKRLRADAPSRDMAMSSSKTRDRATGGSTSGAASTASARPVPRGCLRVATCGEPPAFPSDESGRRELADWLASAENPLTARVIVNRAWHWLFGAGLVRTIDNFGTTGETPSHPELLDCAGRPVHRRGLVDQVAGPSNRPVASLSARRRSTIPSAARSTRRTACSGAPNRRRLDAECIRDAMLSASGRLRSEMGGRSFPPDLDGRLRLRHSSDARRSVYDPVFRNALPDLFEVFDFADPSMVVGRRNASTVAPQALFLMNHPFVLEQARACGPSLAPPSRPATTEPGSIAPTCVSSVGGRPTAERRIALRFPRPITGR